MISNEIAYCILWYQHSFKKLNMSYWSIQNNLSVLINPKILIIYFCLFWCCILAIFCLFLLKFFHYCTILECLSHTIWISLFFPNGRFNLPLVHRLVELLWIANPKIWKNDDKKIHTSPLKSNPLSNPPPSASEFDLLQLLGTSMYFSISNFLILWISPISGIALVLIYHMLKSVST